MRLVEIHNQIFDILFSLVGRDDLLDQIIIFFGKTIDIWVVFLAVGFVLLHKHRDEKSIFSQKSLISSVQEALAIAFSVGGAFLVGLSLKIITAIPRPFLSRDITPLFEYGGLNSFPSNHATVFAALATMIYLQHKRTGIIFIVLGVLISLGRVIAGIHFPIDMIVGWAIGITFSLVLYRFGRTVVLRILKWFEDKIRFRK